MPGDQTITLPSSTGGPTLDAEQYVNAASTTVTRERTAVIPATPTKAQTTIDNNTVSASGNTIIVAAVASQTVRIFRMLLVAQGQVSVSFTDGASTVLAGPYVLDRKIVV